MSQGRSTGVMAADDIFWGLFLVALMTVWMVV